MTVNTIDVEAQAQASGVVPPIVQKRSMTSVVIPVTESAVRDRAMNIVRRQEERSDPVRMATRMASCSECTEKEEDEEKKTMAVRTWNATKSVLPILTWFPNLKNTGIKDILTGDVIAGITTGVVAIPQTMSYADLAGLQYVHGLYSAFLTPLIYALFGESRQLAVGPVAIVSLMVDDGLNGMLTAKQCPAYFNNNPEGLSQSELCPEAYASMVFLASLLVGVTQLLCRVLRLSFLVSFLAHPVISGFTSGAALIIMFSQLKHVVGFYIPKSPMLYQTVIHICSHLNEIKLLNFFLGMLCFVSLYAAKTAAKKWKKVWWLKSTAPLFVCVMGIVLMKIAPSLKDTHSVKVVGYVPSGLPEPSFDWDFSLVPAMLPTTSLIAFIAYMESIAISKAMAQQHGYDISASQELLALGVTNLVGSAFSCYPCSGSFCRSSVNNGMGAQSGLSSIINSSVLLCTLLFLGPAFTALPKFVLGAIVMNAVTGLIETGIKDCRSLWKTRFTDWAMWMAAFIGTLFGVLIGISVAVGLSLVFVIYETVRPQLTVLWRLPGTNIYRSVKQESTGEFVPGVFIVRIGYSLYFANTSYVKETLQQYITNISKADSVRYIILEMTPVTSVDSTAAHALDDVIKEFRRDGIFVAFAMLMPSVERTFRRAHVYDTIGEEWVFHSVHEAVRGCMKHRNQLSPEHSHVGSALANGESDAVDWKRQCSPVVGDEVNVSNDMHTQYTTVTINVRRTGPKLLNEITCIFVDHAMDIRKADLDVMPDQTTMSFLVGDGSTSGKISETQAAELTREIKRWLSKTCEPEPEESSSNISRSEKTLAI